MLDELLHRLLGRAIVVVLLLATFTLLSTPLSWICEGLGFPAFGLAVSVTHWLVTYLVIGYFVWEWLTGGLPHRRKLGLLGVLQFVTIVLTWMPLLMIAAALQFMRKS